MIEITNVRVLYFKGALFLIGGLGASALLIVERPTLKHILLLSVTVWCFCRAYYFAFYVITHYVDSSYKFAGLSSFIAYVWRRSRERERGPWRRRATPGRRSRSSRRL